MIKVFPSSYICWDLETDGFDQKNGYILEVGVAVIREGAVIEEYTALIDNDVEINPKATEVHGITREMCAEEGKKPEEVLTKLLRYIKDAEAHVTHNGTKFDIPFLYYALERAKIDVNYDDIAKHHIDTAALYKANQLAMTKLWNETWPQFFLSVLETRAAGVKFNVKHCCEELEISLEGVQQHRALADVLLTNQIYQKLVL